MNTRNAFDEPETAGRYDSARGLPPQTLALWLDALKSSVPEVGAGKILDLGCGTGRFTAALGRAFDRPVVGVEPSPAMLDVARARGDAGVEYREGRAEALPLDDGSVGLVFMSQVFHHLAEPRRALEEVRRVLTPAGHLAVRNSTRESNEGVEWIGFFPEAAALEEGGTPSRREIEEVVCGRSFELVARRAVRQLFASSYEEYFEKISRRGLSSLISISDEAFQDGLRRLRHHVSIQPRGIPVYESVDLFVFRKEPGGPGR